MVNIIASSSLRSAYNHDIAVDNKHYCSKFLHLLLMDVKVIGLMAACFIELLPVIIGYIMEIIILALGCRLPISLEDYAPAVIGGILYSIWALLVSTTMILPSNKFNFAKPTM